MSPSTEQIAATISKTLSEAAPIPPDCRAIVFTSRNSGLANRVRALVAYQALSQVLGVDFYVDWVPNAPCDEAPGSLLDVRPYQLVDDTAFKRLREQKDVAVLSKSIWFDIIWRSYLSDRCPWLYYARSVHACLKALRPSEDVQREVAAFSMRHDIGAMRGLHIRHTDNVGAYPFWEKNVPDFRPERISQVEGFMDVIASSSDHFFLSTDDAEVEKKILSRFPGRVTVFPKIYRDPIAKVRLRTSTIREALVEMILLGRCRSLIGTYFSSFSIFSAFWAGTEYHEMRGRTVTRNDMVHEFQSAAEELSK
jgi:hypothetical protein